MALGIDNVLVGCWSDVARSTGVTVVLPPSGTQGVLVVRGGAPGTREAGALGPFASGRECHGVVLCGSSVFGLAAADGVTDWCSRHGRGLELNGARVPVVGAAVVFDIRDADHSRPGPEAGVLACEAAVDTDPLRGRVGVGTGCTVGKHGGRGFSVPGGQGTAVVRHGDIVVGVVMGVNAFGDVIDGDGSILAGSTAPTARPRYPYASLEELNAWNDGTDALSDSSVGTTNTTIGCIVTNASLSKADATRAADLAHHGIVRSVRPSHTAADGDALFLLSTGEHECSADLIGEMAAAAVEAAVRSAVR